MEEKKFSQSTQWFLSSRDTENTKSQSEITNLDELFCMTRVLKDPHFRNHFSSLKQQETMSSIPEFLEPLKRVKKISAILDCIEVIIEKYQGCSWEQKMMLFSSSIHLFDHAFLRNIEAVNPDIICGYKLVVSTLLASLPIYQIDKTVLCKLIKISDDKNTKIIDVLMEIIKDYFTKQDRYNHIHNTLLGNHYDWRLTPIAAVIDICTKNAVKNEIVVRALEYTHYFSIFINTIFFSSNCIATCALRMANKDFNNIDDLKMDFIEGGEELRICSDAMENVVKYFYDTDTSEAKNSLLDYFDSEHLSLLEFYHEQCLKHCELLIDEVNKISPSQKY